MTESRACASSSLPDIVESGLRISMSEFPGLLRISSYARSASL